MPEIGVISARITADDRDFQRAFKRARGGIRDLAQRFRTAATRAAKFTAAITAVAVAIGTRLVSAQIKAVDSLQKTSQLLGIQTDRLAGLQFAAEQTGVSTQTLNMGLQRMVRRIAEAAQGSGEAQGAIKDLGLSAQELADQTPDEQLRTLAEALQDVESQSQRVRIAFKLFDSEGAALLNTLAQGEEGLDRFQRTAEQLGIAVSEIESQQVVAAADAINRAQTAFSGVARTATVELAPIIEHLADRFVEASKEAGGFREQILSGMEGAAVAVAHVSNAVRGFQIAWQGVRLAFEGVRLLIMEGLETLIGGIRNLANQSIGHVNRIIEAFNELPFVNIATASAIESGPLEDAFRNQARIARENIDSILVKMNELAMEGADPERVREFFKTLREESRKAAEEAGGAAGGGGAGGEEEGQGGLGAKEREQQQARLDAIRESLMTERELQIEHFELAREQLRKSLENDMLTRKEFNELNRELESQHWERMKGIRKNAMSDLEKFTASSFASQTKTVATELANMTATVAGQNRTMFEINKAAAIADAIVSGYQGVSRTLAAYPFPINVGMAAAHAAVAFAQVSKIRSQSFGGAGGTTAPSVAAGTPAGATPTANAGGGQQGPTREATFNISGDTFGPEAIEKIADSLNEFAGDNGDLRVNVRRAA